MRAALIPLGVTLLLCLVNLSSLVASDEDIIHAKNAWAQFKSRHRRQYTSSEDAMRFKLWLKHRRQIREHNHNVCPSCRHGYNMGENHLSDWLPHEYKRLLGLRDNKTSLDMTKTHRLHDAPYTHTVHASYLPATVNWTAEGYVNPIQDQGTCGSCWAFASCGAMEGQYYKATKTSAILSEQNLIDCSWSFGNQGCNGGILASAFSYVEANRGIDEFSKYPYTGMDTETCSYSRSSSVGYISGHRSIEVGNELALQQAVALIGPVAVGIDAGRPGFQLYESGVYASQHCSSRALNHGVLVVGYGTHNHQPYWLIKNSWGTNWGMQGYMMMARNADNMCGIASNAVFPTDFIPAADESSHAVEN